MEAPREGDVIAGTRGWGVRIIITGEMEAPREGDVIITGGLFCFDT